MPILDERLAKAARDEDWPALGVAVAVAHAVVKDGRPDVYEDVIAFVSERMEVGRPVPVWPELEQTLHLSHPKDLDVRFVFPLGSLSALTSAAQILPIAPNSFAQAVLSVKDPQPEDAEEWASCPSLGNRPQTEQLVSLGVHFRFSTKVKGALLGQILTPLMLPHLTTFTFVAEKQIENKNIMADLSWLEPFLQHVKATLRTLRLDLAMANPGAAIHLPQLERFELQRFKPGAFSETSTFGALKHLLLNRGTSQLLQVQPLIELLKANAGTLESLDLQAGTPKLDGLERMIDLLVRLERLRIDTADPFKHKVEDGPDTGIGLLRRLPNLAALKRLDVHFNSELRQPSFPPDSWRGILASAPDCHLYLRIGSQVASGAYFVRHQKPEVERAQKAQLAQLMEPSGTRVHLGGPKDDP